MALEIRFADAAVLADPARFADAYARLSAARREKLDRLRSPEARRLSLAAGLLLADALAAAGLTADAAAKVALGPFGKPWLPNAPDVHFSLSHSGDRAMCAVADRPVGCDIQLAAPRPLRIAERFFSEAERARIFAEATEEARQAMFFRIWTLKESFLKCIGLGLSLPLNAFSAYPDADGAIVLTQQTDPGRFKLLEVESDPPYRCACCLREA